MARLITIIVLLALVCVILIRLVGRPTLPDSISYQEKLAEISIRSGKSLEHGSIDETLALARFTNLWANLSSNSIALNLSGVYDKNVWFNDTVKTITNQESLFHYMMETAERVSSCSVNVKDISYSDGNYYVRWEMNVVPYSDRTEEVWKSIGISHIRFNEEGLVILHQDYWDSAKGLYEHLPVVGWMIRTIRARL